MIEQELAQPHSNIRRWGALIFNRGIGKEETQLNAKRIVLTNSTIWIAMILSFFFAFFQNLYPINLIFAFFGCLYFIAWWINKPGKSTITKTLLNTIVLFQTITLSMSFGPKIDFEGFFIPSAIIPFLIFNKQERTLFYFSLALAITNIIAVYTLHLNSYITLVSIPDSLYASLNLAFSLISINSMILLAFLFMSITELGETLMIEKTILLENQNLELEKRRNEQENLNVVKDRLLSIIAHDLKNPIHNLQGISDLILQNSLSKEESEFIIKKFKASAQNTSQMLDNLLVWSSAELNKTHNISEEIPLKHFTQEVFKQVSYRATQKEIILINTVPENLCITSDANALEIVLRNLILNAIKFSHNGQEITVSAEEINGNVKIDVTDRGIGIPPEILHKLFHADTSKSRYGTQKEKGFGLGLMLCKQLVEQNKGTINAQSIPEQATILSVLFPVRI